MERIDDNCPNVEQQPETTLSPDVNSGITEEERERWLGDGGAVRPDD
jgi:hypothetical protein